MYYFELRVSIIDRVKVKWKKTFLNTGLTHAYTDMRLYLLLS